MKQLKKQFMKNKLLKQREKINPIVRFALSDMTLIKVRFGILTKWTPIMFRLGARAEKAILRIVKCYA